MRARLCSLLSPTCNDSTSWKWSSTVNTGLSDVSGFWGIMPIWPPRILRIRLRDRPTSSWPSKRISPAGDPAR